MAAPKKDQATTAPPAPQESGLKFFREILGQDWVVSHLKAAMLAGRLAHAYLFVGPGGVGKATTARALAAPSTAPNPGPTATPAGPAPPAAACMRAPIPTFW